MHERNRFEKDRISETWRRLCWLLCVGLLSVTAHGCGRGDSRPEGTITGKVTLGGQPVTTGRVVFSAPVLGASGMADLQGDGSFRLEGALPAGDYKVYFTPKGLGDAPPGEPGQDAPPVELQGVPAKYQSEATTDLSFNVVAGSNQFEMDLQP